MFLIQPETKIDAATLDYLMIELTRTLFHSSQVATTRRKKNELELIEAGFLAPPPPRKELPQGLRDSVASASSVSSSQAKPVAAKTSTGLTEAEESVRQRLEAMGIGVGGNLAER
jgi:hypothetical protein